MQPFSNRTAACLTGFFLSGCMQSTPTAEALTRPTMEAFSRLSSWTPWRSSPPPQPAVVVAAPEAKVAELEPVVARKETTESRFEPRPLREPSGLFAPRSPVSPPASTARAAQAQGASPTLPAKVACEASTEPGQRVRMQCKAVE